MEKLEFLRAVNECMLNKERIESIEALYGNNLPDMIQKLVSFADSVDFFGEERRALEYREIINPALYLEYDFVANHMIPVVDAYENTYIVYSINEKKWGKFSLSDFTLFKERNSFEEVL